MPADDTMLDRAINAYWHYRNCSKTLHDTDRMKAALGVVASEIRSMAESEHGDGLCQLTLQAVAQRIENANQAA